MFDDISECGVGSHDGVACIAVAYTCLHRLVNIGERDGDRAKAGAFQGCLEDIHVGDAEEESLVHFWIERGSHRLYCSNADHSLKVHAKQFYSQA